MDPQTGYDLWAATYDADEASNPVLGLERVTMRELLPPLQGQAVLDLACGTGHYALQAAEAGARLVVGVDLSMGMLRRAREKARNPGSGPSHRCVALVQADQAHLPFPTGTFDVVIHALGMGYAPDLGTAASELGRVLRPGGVALVSELHPLKGKRGQGNKGIRGQGGWQRTFVYRGQRRNPYSGAAGEFKTELILRAYTHPLEGYRAAFRAAGLSILRTVEGRIDEAVRPFFAAAGALDRYEQYQGQPLVVVFELRRVGRIGDSSHSSPAENTTADH